MKPDPVPSLRRRAMPAALAAALAAAHLAGCLDTADEPNGSATAALTTAARTESDLDRPALAPAAPADPIADLDMVAGRATKVPVSWYWAGQVEYPAYHELFIRTVCAGAADDTILIVTYVDEWGAPQTAFSDDTSHPEAQMGSSRCSFVDLGYHWGAVRYYVHVISKNRSTARAVVQYRAPYGPMPNPTWPNIPADNGWHDAPSNDGVTGFTPIGGTLVKVGPLADGDFLEVQTANNGHSGGPFVNANDTQMILFQLPTDGNGALVEGGTRWGNAGMWNDNRNWAQGLDDPANDLDPQISIAGNFPQPASPANYAVLGKVRRFTWAREGTEARVDLVRGPLEQSLGWLDFPWAGGTDAQPILLAPGRYYASMQAAVDHPVGWLDPSVPSTWNTALASMFHYRDEKDVPVIDNPVEDYTCNQAAPIGGSRRGQQNDLAFGLELWRSIDNVNWTVVQRRPIPRAALAAPADAWARLVMELSVDTPAYYKLVAPGSHADGVRFAGSWTVTRNPNASELKLATANMLFNSQQQGLINAASENAHYDNAADLLAGRGDVLTSSLEVRERPDQAPFQWEADIVGLNEVTHVCNGDDTYCCGVNGNIGNVCRGLGSSQPQIYGIVERWFALADRFKAEVESRGTLRWQYVKGRGEYYDSPTGIPADRIPGHNPLFVGENVWPSDGIFFDQPSLQGAGCTVDSTDRDGIPGNYAACLLDGRDDPDWTYSPEGNRWDLDNYAVPARAAVHRFGTAPDRRIVVFNYHGESRDNDERYAEMQSLIAKVKQLLLSTPQSFSPRTDALRSSRKNPELRIVIQGDSNWEPHACGEHYWMLDLLRREFGYAVDASMVTANALDLRLAMHDGLGAGYGPDGFPAGYQPMADSWGNDFHDDGQFGGAWRNNPDLSGPFDPSPSHFPWWASTFKGKTSTRGGSADRHDVFLLVGLGWSQDDAVQSYTIMNNQNLAGNDPLHPDNRAVEMWAGSCWDGGSAVDGSSVSYAPNQPLNGCGTGPGAPALHTDHRPVGIRVRVW